MLFHRCKDMYVHIYLYHISTEYVRQIKKFIFQILTSPNYPRDYPGGLECLYVISTGKGKIITLEIEDLDMEPEKDFVLIRDGPTADDRVLATLTGNKPKRTFISSTGSQLYVYTKTDQADSRRGYRIRYYEGCNAIITKRNGTVHSPAFGSSAYPTNQECVMRIRDPEGGRLSLQFTEMEVHPTDIVQVRFIQLFFSKEIFQIFCAKKLF